MSSTVILAGSPSSTSRSTRLAREVQTRLDRLGVESALLELRTLPAEDLLLGRADAPAIVAAAQLVEQARGVVIVTPIYKAAYSGLLKVFLDVLPQFGLREKVILPVAAGGSLAHVLSLDYALRPVLQSLDPLHVVGGLFLLDKLLTMEPSGALKVDDEISGRLDQTLEAFVRALRRAA